MAWSGNFWRTRRRRGNCIADSYCNQTGLRFAHHRNHHPALARAFVEIAKHHLLPRSEVQATGGDGVAFGRAHEGATQVRVAVGVAPAGVVRVVGVRWRDLLEGAFQVRHAARFVLQGGNAQRGADAGDVRQPGLDAAFGDDARNLRSDIQHVAPAARGDTELILEGGHSIVYTITPLGLGVSKKAGGPTKAVGTPARPTRYGTLEIRAAKRR